MGTGILLQAGAIAAGYLYLFLLPVVVLVLGVIGAELSLKFAILSATIPFLLLSMVVLGSTLYLCTRPLQFASIVAATLFMFHLLFGLSGVAVAAFGHGDMDIAAGLLTLSAIFPPLGCQFAIKGWGLVVADSRKPAWREVFDERSGMLMILLPTVSALLFVMGAVLMVTEGAGRGLAVVLGMGLTAVVVGVWRNGVPIVRTAIDVGMTYRRKSK